MKLSATDYLNYLFFHISIVERERRKDAVSERTPLLWSEPRSPSSDSASPPNGGTPSKCGVIGVGLLSQSPRDP